MKIVVTGGAGFVGTYVTQELQINLPHVQVEVWDRTTGVDISDAGTYVPQLQKLQPDWVIHLAALASVGDSLKNPDSVRRVNVEGTRQLLENIQQVSPATKCIVASSSDIYGQGASTPLPELSLADSHPQNPYAQSKWDMEKMIEDTCNNFVIRVRPFPHIGPGQKLGFVTADFASQVAAIEQGKQEAVIRVGNLEAQRDFTDVRDVARAYRLLIEKGTVGEVYNISSGVATSIQSILDTFLGLARVEITVQEDPTRMRPSDTPILVGDASKIKAATGWQPEIPLKKTLKDILEYWRGRS
jgi:GDP-4-dehydro-6-deoxy-D-mannose reductase